MDISIVQRIGTSATFDDENKILGIYYICAATKIIDRNAAEDGPRPDRKFPYLAKSGVLNGSCVGRTGSSLAGGRFPSSMKLDGALKHT